MSLTNFQLIDLAKALKYNLERVCFKTELCEQKLKYNVGYIINIQDEIDKTTGEDNMGSHWVALYVEKHKNGKVHPFYCDSYGAPPPEEVKSFVGSYVPYSTKDIQSICADVCGFYATSFLFFVSSSKFRTHNIYQDAETYLELFKDLNLSHDFKQNEWMLQCFFSDKDFADKLKRT
jgi:hypothetical protein